MSLTNSSTVWLCLCMVYETQTKLILTIVTIYAYTNHMVQNLNSLYERKPHVFSNLTLEWKVQLSA